MDPDELEPDEAAAELFIRALRARAANIDTAWFRRSRTVVHATTHGEGAHLMNHFRDFDAEVHLICETGAVESAGNLPDDIPAGDHGPVYFNATIRGIDSDPTGHALPSHNSGPTEATLKEDIDPEVVSLLQVAGFEFPE